MTFLQFYFLCLGLCILLMAIYIVFDIAHARDVSVGEIFEFIGASIIPVVNTAIVFGLGCYLVYYAVYETITENNSIKDFLNKKPFKKE